MAFEVAFRLELAHGICVGVALPGLGGEVPDGALDRLHAAEREHARALAPLRRVTWVGGRIALREALGALGVSPGPILATPRGAPALPEGVAGSISHKEHVAVALATRAADGWAVGVDVERLAPRRRDLARYVLRPEELAALEGLSDDARGAEVLFAFSAKEAIYKGLDRFVGRHVSFKEVSVRRAEGGAGAVALHLDPPGGCFEVELRWRQDGELVLTTSRVRRAGGEGAR